MSDLDSFQLIPLITQQGGSDRSGFCDCSAEEENQFESNPVFVAKSTFLKALVVDSSVQ